MRLVAKISIKITDSEIADRTVIVGGKEEFVRHLVEHPSEILDIAKLQRRRSDIAYNPHRINEFEICMRCLIFKTKIQINL